MVTLFTKPGCPPCNATKRQMALRGVDYVEVDITTDEQALQSIIELGYRSAPVVVAGEQHWSGFRPDKINSLA